MIQKQFLEIREQIGVVIKNTLVDWCAMILGSVTMATEVLILAYWTFLTTRYYDQMLGYQDLKLNLFVRM